MPVHPRQTFSSLSKMLPAHTTSVTAGPGGLSHLFRLRCATQRLLFEAVQRKMSVSFDVLRMADNAAEALLEAPL